MKKISFLGLLLIVMFSFCIPSFAHSESNIDIQLESYQKIIDKLNSELGSKMYIREDNKIQVYKSFKNKTPEEIESLLREEYIQNEQNIKSSERKSSDYMRSPAIVNELPSTRSVSEDITQTCSISYNSEAYLDSTIFSPGSTGTYVYESINGYGAQWPSNYTGYHFEVSNGYHTMSSDNKKCTVTLKGVPTNSSRISLAISLKETITFSAN